MTLSLHYTGDWPFERVAAYGPQITAAMHKLAQRFPRDVNVPALFDEIISGARQLWLILDDEDFKSFMVSEIKDNPFTGNRSLMITSLAGEGGEELVSLIGDVEAWAAENGIHEVIPAGRKGWGRELAKAGYTLDICLFRKEIGGIDGR